MDNELTSADVEYYTMFPDQMAAAGITQEMLDAVGSTIPEPVVSEEDAAYDLWIKAQEKAAEEANAAIQNEGQSTTPFSVGNVDFFKKIEAARQERLKQREAAVPVAAADSLTKKDLYGEKPGVGVIDRPKNIHGF
mgnify:FL=1